MPKAILEFSLPEDQEEHLNAVRGTSYKIALDEMDNYFRNRLKYEEVTNEVRTALEEARENLTALVLEAEQ